MADIGGEDESFGVLLQQGIGEVHSSLCCTYNCNLACSRIPLSFAASREREDLA